jgi:hypothetical protein
VRQLRELFGPVQLEMQVMFGDMEFAKAKRTVELFGRDIIPAVGSL